jgi:hypothetical protein
MIKLVNRKSLQVSAAFSAGLLLSTTQAHAAGGNNFSSIASNIITSIASLPGLLSGVAYMFGILLGVLGILKIKDHVENPGQTPLKDGAIRLAAGGGLFALPLVYEAMTNTIGTGGQASAATLNAVTFSVN